MKLFKGCACVDGGSSSGKEAACPEDATADAKLSLADRLDAALKRVEQIAAAWESAERAAGLTPAQRRTLEALCGCAGCTCSVLAEETGVSASTLTRHIDPLVEAGLVERIDGEDRRVIHLCCTPTGKESGERIRERKQAFIEGILARVPETKRESVVDALEELIRAFGEFAVGECC